MLKPKVHIECNQIYIANIEVIENLHKNAYYLAFFNSNAPDDIDKISKLYHNVKIINDLNVINKFLGNIQHVYV